MNAHASFLWVIKIRRRGGVWRRHCRALLRKHVLPLLNSPLPRLQVSGHVVSMLPGYNEMPLVLGWGAFVRFTGVVAGVLVGS